MKLKVTTLLEKIDTLWRIMEHNGMMLCKSEVRCICDYAIDKGYEYIHQIPDEEINEILSTR